MVSRCGTTTVSGSNAEDKFDFLQDCDTQRNFNRNLSYPVKMNKANVRTTSVLLKLYGVLLFIEMTLKTLNKITYFF